MRLACLQYLCLLFLAASAPCPCVRAQDKAESKAVDAPAETLVEEAAERTGESPEGAIALRNEAREVAEQPQSWPPIPLRATPSVQLTSPSGPDVFMLPDEGGKLRMVLGFRYEDFLRTWQQRDKATNFSPPQYLFDSVDISGEADDVLATLQVRIDLVTQANGWVEVPLQMPGLIVQKFQIENETDGECVVFDRDRKSYFVWLKSQPGSHRRLDLDGLLRLKVDAGAPSLELFVPRAINSSLTLQVPAAAARFQVPLGLSVSSSILDDKGTQVRVTGSASPLRLSWKVPQAKPPASNQAIEAIGQQTVRIARRSIRYEVDLAINGVGTPPDSVRVRLPYGTKLVHNRSTTQFRIKPIAAVSSGRGQIVEIRARQQPALSSQGPAKSSSPLQNQRPLTFPWQVQLVAEQAIEEENEQFACSVSGFEVIDAYRQSGSFDLQIEDPLQAYFDLAGNLEQVPLAERAVHSADVKTIARFDYSQFPWELTVHILPRLQRVTVRPQYELVIDSGEAQLRVDCDYQLTGARTFFLRLDMRGWRLTDTPLESGGTVDQNLYTVTQQGLLNLPLLNPDTSRVPLSFVARKEIQLGRNTFDLPEPLGVFVADGLLTVRCKPALKFSPKLIASKGLGLLAAAQQSGGNEPSDSLATGKGSRREDFSETLAFRTYQSAPSLDASITQRPREVAVDINTEVKLESEIIRVAQRLHYKVDFRPLSQLPILMPEELWLNDSLVVQLDGEDAEYGLEVVSQEETASNVPAATPDARRLVIALPRPREGKFQLDFSYNVSTPQWTSSDAQPISLPLAAPDMQVVSHQVGLQYEQPLRASLNQVAGSEDWLYPGNGEDSTQTIDEIRLHSTKSPMALPLLLQLDPDEEPELATLEGAWLQNWILADRQQVRAVFRFRSPRVRAFVRLPEKLAANELEVLLEGRPVPFEILAGNRLAISIPEGNANKSQTVELRYQRPARLSDWGSLSFRQPILESRSSNTPVYWQLILPANWHVYAEPEKLIGDYWLGWKDYRWGRQPNLYQAELERLTEATPLPPPPESMNQYLFQTFQLTSEIKVSVLRRAWLVLGSTLLAFGIGLLCLYTQLVRRKEFWLILALALFALVFSFPEVSLLIVQVILWGGVLTLMAAVLRRFIVSPDSEPFRSSDLLTGMTAATESWSRAQINSPSDRQEMPTSVQVGESK